MPRQHCGQAEAVGICEAFCRDEGRRRNGRAPAPLALGLPFGIGIFVERHGQQSISQRIGGLVSFIDELAAPPPIERAKFLERHVDHDVGFSDDLAC